ncbi:MAG: hypothetical protein ACOVNR_01205 [Chitinophagaceae bacterium]
MKRVFVSLSIVSSLLFACNNQPESTTTENLELKSDTTDIEPDYSLVKFDNTKDPVCGMPVSSGVSDTAHFDGKVLGFCAKECKEAFLAKATDFKVE